MGKYFTRSLEPPERRRNVRLVVGVDEAGAGLDALRDHQRLVLQIFIKKVIPHKNGKTFKKSYQILGEYSRCQAELRGIGAS